MERTCISVCAYFSIFEQSNMPIATLVQQWTAFVLKLLATHVDREPCEALAESRSKATSRQGDFQLIHASNIRWL